MTASTADCAVDTCGVVIDRGMAYACGGEHGVGLGYCDGYFCYSHLIYDDFLKRFVCVDCLEENERMKRGV